MDKNNLLIRIAATIAFLAMIAINALANTLPINGITTGDVSDAYGNLFAPAALTFSIWGLIYLWLAVYTLYQLGLFQQDRGEARKNLYAEIGKFYILTSLANVCWIFSWHYDLIWLSVIFMAALLFCLIKISDILKKEQFSRKEKFFIHAPFSIYFGWITVATIANITTFLVTIGWNGFGITEQVWALVILLVGAAIGIARMFWDKNMVYGLVLIWAYLGIWMKHSSPAGFAGQYGIVASVAIFCIAAFIISEALIFSKSKRKSAEL